MTDREPIFYGAVTVGERGQVVIPQAAREALGIRAGDKILVLGGGRHEHGLMLIKAEAMSAFIARISAKLQERLGSLERLVQLSQDRPEKGETAKRD